MSIQRCCMYHVTMYFMMGLCVVNLILLNGLKGGGREHHIHTYMTGSTHVVDSTSASSLSLSLSPPTMLLAHCKITNYRSGVRQHYYLSMFQPTCTIVGDRLCSVYSSNPRSVVVLRSLCLDWPVVTCGHTALHLVFVDL